MNTTETEEEAPIISYARALGNDKFQHGYIKCRLFHLEGASIVVPDVLMLNNLHKHFFTPQFFTPNCISFFGGDGSADHCRFTIDLIEGFSVKMAFFKNDLVKKCTDHSFIYKCVFYSVDGNPLPEPHGKWRKRGNQFELALYHHTNAVGKAGIKHSKEIWGSKWNIQGITELKNIAYGYFTSIPKIKNTADLNAIGMSPSSEIGLIATNMPYNPMFAYRLKVYRKTTTDRNIPLAFWVDVEMISPNHLFKHPPKAAAVYYERVLPKVFRAGINPDATIPLNGMMLDLKLESRKSFDYVIVGNADTEEGLKAPYAEEETKEICKLETDSNGLEIIGIWEKKQNSDLFSDRNIEVAKLTNN